MPDVQIPTSALLMVLTTVLVDPSLAWHNED